MKGAITSPVIKWRFATGADVEWQYSAIADVDGDGQTEVVIGSFDGKVYCLRGSEGFQKWAFTSGAPAYSSPAVADCDGDGQAEIVVGSNDYKVYCLRGTDGAQKWAFATGGAVWSSPAVADCDGDGRMEVVVGSRNDYKVYCLRGSDGTQKWAFTTGGFVYSSPAIADVDGDGQVEIVIGSYDGKVYCLRGSDGTQKWAFTTSDYVHLPGALVDIDGDSKFEYLVSQATTSTLYCLNAENGSVAWQKGLAQDIHSPFAGDIDGDGCSEMIVGTQYADALGYRVFAIDDPANSTNCGTLDIGEGGLGSGFEFRPAGQSIYLFMPTSAQVSLRLYDAQGRLVQRLYDGVLASGGHTFNPALESKGVYMAVLRYQGGMKSLKIVR
jgi:outer membrane protein assembly factor BamB